MGVMLDLVGAPANQKVTGGIFLKFCINLCWTFLSPTVILDEQALQPTNQAYDGKLASHMYLRMLCWI